MSRIQHKIFFLVEFNNFQFRVRFSQTNFYKQLEEHTLP